MRPNLWWVAALALAACESEGKPPPAPVPAAAAPSKPRPVVTDITAQDYEAPRLPSARVQLVDAFGGKHPVQVEVAATRDSRTRGLMWRTELAEGKGMLFLFDRDQPLSFWMKNTLIPLDMIFIRSDMTIVGIVERAEPRTFTSRAPRGGDSMYVLEVPGGWSEKIGLKAGLKVAFEGLNGLAGEP